MNLRSWWVDGHLIVALNAEDAADLCEGMYTGHIVETVRPWTDEDQDELVRQTAFGDTIMITFQDADSATVGEIYVEFAKLLRSKYAHLNWDGSVEE